MVMLSISFIEQDHDGLRMMMMMIGSPIIADHGNPEKWLLPKIAPILRLTVDLKRAVR